MSYLLQSKNALLDKIKIIINGNIQCFEELRFDDEFYTFWQKITSFAEMNDPLKYQTDIKKKVR